jgi:hypothetical protein
MKTLKLNETRVTPTGTLSRWEGGYSFPSTFGRAKQVPLPISRWELSRAFPSAPFKGKAVYVAEHLLFCEKQEYYPLFAAVCRKLSFNNLEEVLDIICSELESEDDPERIAFLDGCHEIAFGISEWRF